MSSDMKTLQPYSRRDEFEFKKNQINIKQMSTHLPVFY